MAPHGTSAPIQWPTFKPDRRETSGDGLHKDVALSVTKLEEMIQEHDVEPEVGQKISPERLYRVSGEDSGTSKMLRVRQIIQDSVDRMSDALYVEDEIERESEMNLITQDIFELIGFIKIDKCFKDAICLIVTAVQAHTKSVYTRPQIVALQKVLSLMKDNIYMDEDILDACSDILEAASFDINAPLEGAELPL